MSNDPNSKKSQPKKLKPANPGKNPQPSGCICTWTPGDLGWFRGPNPNCPVSH